MKSVFNIAVLLTVVILTSCNRSEEIIGTDEKPVISFDSQDHIYTVKAGKSLLLQPAVSNNENATYRWLQNGITVGRQQSYTFIAEESGEYYLTFEVTNAVATVFEEIRIDVVGMLPPSIVMAIPEGGFILLAGTEKEFSPVVMNGEGATFAWFIGDEKVADTKKYIFGTAATGEYAVRFRAGNEDGSCEVDFNISVRNPEDIPFTWEWEKEVYSGTVGRAIVLGPISVANEFDAVYTWTFEGEVVYQGDTPTYTFVTEQEGDYSFTVTMENQYGQFPEQRLTVRVYDNEAANLRPATVASNADFDKVWDYMPAPGQFVNMGNYATREQEIASVTNRLNANQYVSLGAFGGYIVVGFDHSVINDGGYNIQILGNSFDGSSEPGIVWVMQDENGDGLPNDTWYELKGSEHGKPGTIQNYSITYYRPSGARMDTPWVDNLGNSGVVEVNNFHTQDYYFPGWIEADYYTLRGTRLEDNVTYTYGTGWRIEAFGWGYADNFGSDRLTDDENKEAGSNPNHFRISDAVDANGDPVKLRYVDFVKVQTAIQAQAGNLGEVSTEVLGFRDYNMIKDN